MQKSYRELLKELYLLRKRRNSSYSLVAFSRDAGFKSYHMNDIISGRYGLSPARAIKVAEHLKMSEFMKEEFLTLVHMESARSPIEKKAAMDKLESLKYSADRVISVEEFNPISKWFYLAVLELLRKYEVCPSYEEISEKLGISVDQARDCIEKLKSAGILSFADGRIELKFELLTIKSQPSEVIRSFHKEMINKAVDSMESVDFKKRYIGSYNVLLTQEEYNNLVVELTSFIRKTTVDRQKNADAHSKLHAINLQVFPLEKNSEPAE